MEKSKITFGRDMTQILKGIALLLMLVHHTATPELWADKGTILYSVLQHLVSSTKMCVYIFAFLVGYGFYCSKKKSLKYSFKRISLLLVPFWTMMTLLFIPSAVATGRIAEQVRYDFSMGGGKKYTGLDIQLFRNLGVTQLV